MGVVSLVSAAQHAVEAVREVHTDTPKMVVEGRSSCLLSAPQTRNRFPPTSQTDEEAYV